MISDHTFFYQKLADNHINLYENPENSLILTDTLDNAGTPTGYWDTTGWYPYQEGKYHGDWSKPTWTPHWAPIDEVNPQVILGGTSTTFNIIGQEDWPGREEFLRS